MKIIDLLNKIANGEEVPKKIRCFLHEGNNDIFTYIEEEEEYYNGLGFLIVPNHHLNDEVEIIEEEKFEDIRELGIPEIDTIENERMCKAEYKINDLIRNQKKIITELNKLKGGKNDSKRNA